MRAAGRVKSFIKSNFPRAVAAYHEAHQAFRRPSLKTVFSEIYHKNVWQDPESVSGRGSTLARTAAIMSDLPSLLKELQAKTLLDAACGDFNWIRYTKLGVVKYTGADVVPDLIARNRRLYGGEGRAFVVLDVTKDRLPSADVILCRDCLIHLSFGSIHASVANFKRADARYLICTTHTTVQENTDCPDGGWRSVNLQLPPFNFPPPLKLIVEDAELGKCLGVWRLDEL
ncbi:MAG TPA: class I SAM-dependent methyltransferase [Pyrinomonadaceae bacterium]